MPAYQHSIGYLAAPLHASTCLEGDAHEFHIAFDEVLHAQVDECGVECLLSVGVQSWYVRG